MWPCFFNMQNQILFSDGSSLPCYHRHIFYDSDSLSIMTAECPFCGYRNTAYEVQMHIDERHAYDSPLPTRQALYRPRDYQPRQPTRNSPALPRELGERFRLSPPAPEPKHYPIGRRPLEPHQLDEYPIREKRVSPRNIQSMNPGYNAAVKAAACT